MQITAAICKHQAQTKKSTKHRSIICRLQNAKKCTKRRSPNTGAAVLAPHGAFGSAAPVSQSGVPEACRTLLPISADSKASDGPRPTRRPDHPKPTKMHFAAPQPQNLRFLADFLPIENSLKIRLLKNAPKTSKVGPLIAQTSILGSLLGSILAKIFMKFSILH